MSNKQALRNIADMMEDDDYEIDAYGITALCLRDAADEIDQLEKHLADWREWYERDGSVGGASALFDKIYSNEKFRHD